MTYAKARERIRCLRGDDLPELAAASQRALGPYAWSENDFVRFANRIDHWVKVVRHKKRIVGAVAYVLHEHVVVIRHLFVDPAVRRRGLGTRLVRHILTSLKRMRRRLVACNVPERWLPMQMLLKSCQFVCFRTLKRKDGDVYCMRYTAPQR